MNKKYLRNDYKVQYCTALTGEILAALDDLIDQDAEDDKFLKAHDRVYNIIKREYVELEDQKKESTK